MNRLFNSTKLHATYNRWHINTGRSFDLLLLFHLKCCASHTEHRIHADSVDKIFFDAHVDKCITRRPIKEAPHNTKSFVKKHGQ